MKYSPIVLFSFAILLTACGDDYQVTAIPPAPVVSQKEKLVVIETVLIYPGRVIAMNAPNTTSYGSNAQKLRVQKQNGAKLSKITVCLQNDIDGDGFSDKTFWAVPGVEQIGTDEWIGNLARGVGSYAYAQLTVYDSNFIIVKGFGEPFEGGRVAVSADLSAFEEYTEFFIELSHQVPSALSIAPIRLTLDQRGICGPDGVTLEGTHDGVVVRVHPSQLTVFKDTGKG